MNRIINGRLVLPDSIQQGDLYFDSVIAGDTAPRGDDTIIDAKGLWVVPGFIDIHIHGYAGEDASDGDEKGLRHMAAELVKNGVTGFCPTTMTLPKDTLRIAFDAARKVRNAPDTGSARVIGVNSEGPFISEKKRGAQNIEYIADADTQFVRENSDIIKLLTVAPENRGALEMIRSLQNEGNVVVSLGHSDCDIEAAEAAIDAGARHATHLFNAMTRIDHRSPGLAVACLTDDRVTCELICDTFHVHPALYALTDRMKGDHYCLITDCLRCGGMEDGEYELGGQTVYKQGIKCLLGNGTIAGSVLTMNMAVKNLREHTGMGMAEAVRHASLVPAKVLGIDHETGSLEKGKRADIVLMDDDYRVRRVFIGGKEAL